MVIKTQIFSKLFQYMPKSTLINYQTENTKFLGMFYLRKFILGKHYSLTKLYLKVFTFLK